ncbi:hypothetical protein TorRG33x02_271800, partial [Trema orientale]
GIQVEGQKAEAKVHIDLTSSSDSEKEFEDPDYVSRRLQPQQENRNLGSNINIKRPRQVVLALPKFVGSPNPTSRNKVLIASTTTTPPITNPVVIRRRPGRPPKPRTSTTIPPQENREPLVARRRRRRRRRRGAPYSLRKRVDSSGDEVEKRTILAVLIDLT